MKDTTSLWKRLTVLELELKNLIDDYIANDTVTAFIDEALDSVNTAKLEAADQVLSEKTKIFD
jgi:hypothetical protein